MHLSGSAWVVADGEHLALALDELEAPLLAEGVAEDRQRGPHRARRTDGVHVVGVRDGGAAVLGESVVEGFDSGFDRDLGRAGCREGDQWTALRTAAVQAEVQLLAPGEKL